MNELYDPFSHELRDDPYPVCRTLRDCHPLYYCESRRCRVLSRFGYVGSQYTIPPLSRRPRESFLAWVTQVPRIAFSELNSRSLDWRVTGAPQRLHSSPFRGLLSLPVCLPS